MKAITKRQLYDYFLLLATTMGLGSWHFEFDEDEPSSAAGSPFLADADIMVNDHAEAGTLRLAQHLIDKRPEPDYIRRVLVHEALHCYRARTSTMVRLDLEDLLGKAADGLFWRSYSRLREVEIEAVARVLAPYLPLPPWAEKS